MAILGKKYKEVAFSDSLALASEVNEAIGNIKSDSATYIVIRGEGQSDDDCLASAVPEGTQLVGGDICIIKTLVAGTTDKYLYTAFVWDVTTGEDGAWKAMDGNYDATNVYMTSNITLAGSYTNVGNLNKGSNTATKEYVAKGKSIADILSEMLSQDTQPAIVANPAVSLTLKVNGANVTKDTTYEAGTTLTLGYAASLSAGSYTAFAGQVATGVTASGWSASIRKGTSDATMTAIAGTELTTASGTFTGNAITLADGQWYDVNVSATHGAGAVAKTALGKTSSPEVKIAAGTKSANSVNLKGYNNGRFYGCISDGAYYITNKCNEAAYPTSTKLTSAKVRSLNKQGSSTATGTFTINVTAGTKTIVIAALGSNRTLSKVLNTTVNADMTEGFKKDAGTLVVAAADGDTSSAYAKTYTVWTYTPDLPYSGAASLSITIA